MPNRPIKAFVSSTYADLKDHRATVIRTLRDSGFFVDPMENWTAESDEPKKFSQDRLEGCDFCVLLVALRRGFVPTGETQSITQLEYSAALAEDIDVLPYLLDEAAPWPAQYNELGRDPEIGAWRKHLEESHGRELFTEDPSSIDVGPAVVRWVTKRMHPVVSHMTAFAGELAAYQPELAARERREQVTEYLDGIHGLIEHAHDELEQGEVPHGTCQQIYDTGGLLVRAIGDAVGPDDLARLEDLLRGAYEVESLHMALQDPDDRRLNLAELARTGGSFKALVDAIRASPIEA